VPNVEVSRAARAERLALENMFQLYTHDFSEQWWDRPYGELEDNGRFGDDYPFDLYWEDEGHIPILLRLDGKLVGFALLDNHSHSGGALDRNMAEFFIVRKHRRGGVGTAAAHTIFSTYPGRWEAAVARRNTGALPFWRKTVASHPAVSAIEEVDVATAAWDGPVLRFSIGSASAKHA
jgi:predicted acetyltransferase